MQLERGKVGLIGQAAAILAALVVFWASPAHAQDFSCEIAPNGHDYGVYVTARLGAAQFPTVVTCTVWCRFQTADGPKTRSCRANLSATASYRHARLCTGSDTSQLLEVTRTTFSCGPRR